MPNTPTRPRPASLNAAKHFCTSETLIIDGESMEEFDALVDEFARAHKPRTNADWHWVEATARCLWFSRRSCREFDEMMRRLPPKRIDWNAAQQAEHERFFRYRKADEREFERASRGVEHIRIRREQRRKQKVAEDRALADTAYKTAKTRDLDAKLAAQKTSPKPAPASQKPQPAEPAPRLLNAPAPAPQLWDQRIFVKISEDVVTLKSYPTNQQTRIWAKTAARPGARVDRVFRFPDGVPPAFEWMLPPDERKPDASYRQRMPLETWLEITAEEERRGDFLDHTQWRKPAA